MADDSDCTYLTWLTHLLSTLKARELMDVSIGYRDFVKLTTFSSSHCTGQQAMYALHRDERGKDVEISAGCALPLVLDGFEWGEEDAAAEHLENANIRLPASAARIAKWLYDQGGDVEFAIDGLPGVTVEAWVEGVAQLVPGLQAEVSDTPVAVPEVARSFDRVRVPGRFVDIALHLLGIEARSARTAQVIDYLRGLEACQALQFGLTCQDGRAYYFNADGVRRELTSDQVRNALCSRKKKA